MNQLSKNKIRFFIYIIKIISIYAIMLVKWFLTPRSKNKIARYKATNLMLKGLRKNITIYGESDSKADIIMVNHTNMLDILLLESYYKIDVCWIGKKEISRFGMMTYPRHIVIDRSDKSSMLSMIKKAKKALSNGRPIVIFPEGTRNKNDTLLPFKEGAKVLAQIIQARIQPVVISGAKETINFSQKTLNPDVQIKIQFLEPIEIKKNNQNYETWYNDLHKKMNEIYEKENKSLKGN